MKKMKLWLYPAMKWIGSLFFGISLLLNSCQQQLADPESTYKFVYDIIPCPQEIKASKSTFKLSSNKKIVYDTAFKKEAMYLKDYLFSKFLKC